MAGIKNKYSYTVFSPIKKSTEKLFRHSFDHIQKKFNISNSEDEAIPNFLFRDVGEVNHAGKICAEKYISNIIPIMPLIDPDLYKIKIYDENCDDKDLLMALIYKRYCPELLEIKFDKNRKIDEKTLAYAKSISDRFPYKKIADISANSVSVKNNKSPVKTRISNFLSMIQNKVTKTEITAKMFISVPEDEAVEEYLKKCFLSAKTRKTFATEYSEEIYRDVLKDIETRKYFPMTHVYGILAITKIIDDVTTSKICNYENSSMYFDNLANGESHRDSKDDEMLLKMHENMVARIDIKNHGEGNDFEIVEISDEDAKIQTPIWFAQKGTGRTVESMAGKLNLIIKCIGSGKLTIDLRGRDVRDSDGKRIPKWIHYTKMSANNIPCLHSLTSAWHDKPFKYSCDVANGEVFHIYIEWQPNI